MLSRTADKMDCMLCNRAASVLENEHLLIAISLETVQGIFQVAASRPNKPVKQFSSLEKQQSLQKHRASKRAVDKSGCF